MLRLVIRLLGPQLVERLGWVQEPSLVTNSKDKNEHNTNSSSR